MFDRMVDSHSLTVLSPDADAVVLPSSEKATALTESFWPSSFCLSAPHRTVNPGITSKCRSRSSKTRLINTPSFNTDSPTASLDCEHVSLHSQKQIGGLESPLPRSPASQSDNSAPPFHHHHHLPRRRIALEIDRTGSDNFLYIPEEN
jgi:hypothetical protein